jgi:uncharacterized protein YndB with AHSA1/START domain
MASEAFVYVTYIRTTAEKLWDALVQPEFTRVYWSGFTQESEWKRGSSWKLKFPDGRIADSGKIIEIDRPRRLSISWRNEFRPELREEGYSRCTFELKAQGDLVKLTVTHGIDREGSKLVTAVSQGWPMNLASLKSLLETGEALNSAYMREQ